jgi:hypothetical protein
MKWIGGVILIIVTIILLIIAVFMFPWFSTKTTYEQDTIEKYVPDYWEENLGGEEYERDWDETVYHLQSYEIKSSRPINMSSAKSGASTSSGMLHYNSEPSAGGWEGNHKSMIEAGYPVPGFLPGGPEQLAVYNFTYYLNIISIIMAIVCIIFIILAGLEKIGAIIPKILVGITIIFVVLGPLYFALGLPAAIEADSKEYNKVRYPGNSTAEYNRPAEAGGIMGKANEMDDASDRVTSTTEFAPGLGWWLAVGAIFTTIITIGFITGPGAAAYAKPDDERSRRKYHEYDDLYDRDRAHYSDEGRTRYDADHEPYRGEYDDGQPRYSRRPPPSPPRSQDYGRPPPRPPRRPGGYPPPHREHRRPPPNY